MANYNIKEEEEDEKKEKKGEAKDKKFRLAAKMTTKEKKGGPGYVKSMGKEPHPHKNG